MAIPFPVVIVLMSSACCMSMTSSQSSSLPAEMAYNASSESDNPLRRHHRNRRESATTNRKLIVTTILEEPYMMMKERSAFLAGNDRFEGYLADILQRLATSVGFQYETRLSRDGKYGELGPDGRWNGMIGEVQSGEADIAAGALIVTDTLRQYVDFTEPFLSMRWSALLRRPADDFAYRQTTSSRRHGQSASAGGGGNQRRPAGASGDGSSTTSRRLTNAAQLLKSNELMFGVVENSVAHQMLATSGDPVARALNQRMISLSTSSSSSSSSSSSYHRSTSPHHSSSDPFVGSIQEGVDRARRERYAFILDSPTAEYVASREPCDLYTVEPFLDVASYAFAIRRRPAGSGSGPSTTSSSSSGSSDDTWRLRQAIDREMRRMKHSGEMQAMYLRWWRDECAAMHPISSVSDDVERSAGRRGVSGSGTGDTGSSADNGGDVWRRHARVSGAADGLHRRGSGLDGLRRWRTVVTGCIVATAATLVDWSSLVLQRNSQLGQYQAHR